MTRNRTYDMHDTAICTCPSQRPQKSQPPLKRSECPDSFNGTSTAMRPAAGFDASVFILCSALVGFLACGIGIGMCVDLGFFHSETGMQWSVPSRSWYKFQSANQTWSTKKKIFRKPFPSISQHFGILKLRLAQLVLPRAQRHLYWTTSVSNASWSCPHAQHTCGTGIVSCSVIRPILKNCCSLQNWETKHQLYNCT